MIKLVQTIEIDNFIVQPREGNLLYVDGYIGCYSEYEGWTSNEHIRGIVEVSVTGDRITQIVSDDLEHVSSEYDGAEWDDIILELEDLLRNCFRVISNWMDRLKIKKARQLAFLLCQGGIEGTTQKNNQKTQKNNGKLLTPTKKECII